jgi:hypothetical protein
MKINKMGFILISQDYPLPRRKSMRKPENEKIKNRKIKSPLFYQSRVGVALFAFLSSVC